VQATEEARETWEDEADEMVADDLGHEQQPPAGQQSHPQGLKPVDMEKWRQRQVRMTIIFF
jgi:hypothetical protein